MSKPSRSGPRYGASKKKPKKRPNLQPVAQISSSVADQEPVQPRPEANGAGRSGETVLQFRPRSRESSKSSASGAKAGAAAKTFQQAVDYSYVYTDLKIIGGLSVALFGGLIALSFLFH